MVCRHFVTTYNSLELPIKVVAVGVTTDEGSSAPRDITIQETLYDAADRPFRRLDARGAGQVVVSYSPAEARAPVQAQTSPISAFHI